MNVTAELLAGVPPFGRGVFGRASLSSEDLASVGFCSVNMNRADRAQQAAAWKSAGKQIWVSSGPDDWMPATWRASLERAERVATELGAVGVIADPEWPDGVGASADATALGQALRALSSRTRVGVTSFPLFPFLDELGRACGDRVFGVVQIYGRTIVDGNVFASWFARWQRHFGARMAIAVAGWTSSSLIATPALYSAYLRALPRSMCWMAWPGQTGIEASKRAIFARSEPGGSALGTLAYAGAAFMGRPIAIAATVALMVLIFVAIGGTKYAFA